MGTLTASVVEAFLHDHQIPVFVENGAATLHKNDPSVPYDVSMDWPEASHYSDDKPSLMSSPPGAQHGDRTSPPPGFAHELPPREESGQERGEDHTSIKMLPTNALLQIFYFYLNDKHAKRSDWYTLARVSRQWRDIVISSRLLGAQLVYTGSRGMREIPLLLPIAIEQGNWDDDDGTLRADNIAALLNSKHRDRVRTIDLVGLPKSLWEKIAAVMEMPFPELESVTVWLADYDGPTLPRSFLGGSAPRLRILSLHGIQIPGMLAFSAKNLVRLFLLNMPDLAYISLQALFTSLSAMTHLKQLVLTFQSPRFPLTYRYPRLRPNLTSRLPPPLTPLVLPALTSLTFQGVCEYLEEFVAQTHAPLLRYLSVHLFVNIHVDVPGLYQFISGAEELTKSDRATVHFSQHSTRFVVSSTTGLHERPMLEFVISSREPSRQLSSLAKICRSLIPPFSTLRYLRLLDDVRFPRNWKDDADGNEWLELLDPFISVNELYLSREIALRVWLALNDPASKRVANVLPALESLIFEGHEPSGRVKELVGRFVAARQLLGQPVVVGISEKEDDEE
ncbi:hypothetical protein F5148DRAFT_542387 [Russula earlei]|uniref:Uncharacterized protein n=1 Tax=Russula earlei TaxID=71964 RepID=A0ACC0UGA5_9AGAM|nr:hypothetical protein F5148DRAFT_542387 [Russula earlei]